MEPASLVRDWRRDVFEAVAQDPDIVTDATGEPLTIVFDDAPQNPMRLPTSAGRRKTTAFVMNSDDDDDEDKLRKAPAPKRRNSNRDSQRRRELLLVGKEGSRQRRRWENDRLMHVPNAQPPLPSDWEARPTHKVHYNLPYHLAKFWDLGMREMVNERRAAEAILHRQQLIARQSQTTAPKKTQPKKEVPREKFLYEKYAGMSSAASSVPSSLAPTPKFGMVTRDLRVAVKKSETIKRWVRALEEPVRQYVFASEAMRRAQEIRRSESAATVISGDSSVASLDGEDGGSETASATYALSDEDDDELVFVGRCTLARKRAKAELKQALREANAMSADNGILFDSLGDGETGAFKRWIAHSLSDYYGLTSRSTNTDASKRVVCVSMRDEAIRAGAGPILIPRPMWELFEATAC
ncbi:hypothetical protein SCUCBS95973_004914 [Sporothrix curviconia]|uniref:R3H domain-containing protein n=1 Tax=Sporothrix curviconia TaxID=1260050 RepID=A0ABP0BTB7_9PEZI